MFDISIIILVCIQYANYWHSVVLKNIFIPILANITFSGEAKRAYNNISGDNTEMAESYTLLSLFFISRDIYLAKNHNERYSICMVPTGQFGGSGS